MTFDLTAHMKAMSRTVRNLERDGKPAKAVVASCIYNTDPSDLWDALTNPKRLPRWFSPVTGDLRQGGRYQIEGNAGGTITRCDREKRIEVTWEMMGGVSWVNITLIARADGTELELEHIAHIDPHWDQFGPGAVGVGWDLSFLGLALHLTDPSFVKPESEDEWLRQPESKDFVRGASDGWAQAAITAGEDRAKALESAESTRKFYTGEATPPGA
jgi:uncharacterized protein YndB with AHSA1/START domain